MRRAWVWLLFAALIAPCAVSAQDESEDDSEASESEEAGEPTAEAEEAAVAPSAAPTWWFGAYLQGAFVPSFMLKLFLAEAPTVANFVYGVTATHRTPEGTSFVIGLGYASYGFAGPFRVKGDPETDTEYLDSSLGLLHLRGQILWSSEIVKDKLSFEYGIGLDIGVVLGELRRTEAYRDTAGAFQPCGGVGVAPLNPGAGPAYCEPTQSGLLTDAYDAEGAHYNVAEKSVPPVMAIPMLPALALRYTPIRELAIKLDAAFGLLQFSVGLSAAYGVDL
ncbi:MAG: hypothetical protein ABW321_28225 [Polyangiales bacterium]